MLAVAVRIACIDRRSRQNICPWRLRAWEHAVFERGHLDCPVARGIRRRRGVHVRAGVPELGVEVTCSVNWGGWTREGADKGGGTD